jgi:hypothetical protein
MRDHGELEIASNAQPLRAPVGILFLQEDTEKRGREVLTHFTYRYFTFVS